MIRQIYDGAIVPGNYPLAVSEREKRLERYYRPYHDAIAATIAGGGGIRRLAVHLSIHSFTPVMQGEGRPWHVGVLWDLDDRAPRPLIDMLAADPLLSVGDNEPYDGALRGDTALQARQRQWSRARADRNPSGSDRRRGGRGSLGAAAGADH